MKVGVLGSGSVGKSIAEGLLKLGYSVKVGTRDSAKLSEWQAREGAGASVGSFAQAAAFGEVVFLCTNWHGTKNAIDLAGVDNFSGKVVVDVTNPLLFESAGTVPKLAIGFPQSAGALVQSWLPESKVVKAFNTVTAGYMTDARKLQEGVPDLFICGNDLESKTVVSGLAQKWGWPVIDVGGIENAYLLESLAMLWITYGFLNNHWTHAVKLLKK